MSYMEIKAPCDLRGRKAAMLCQAFNDLGIPVWIVFRNRSVPASKQLGVETLGIKKEDAIVIVSDQNEKAIESIFNSIQQESPRL